MKNTFILMLITGLLFFSTAAYNIQDVLGGSVIGTVTNDAYELNSGAVFLRTGGDQTGIEDNIPSSFELYQNYPNPFNPATTINFSLPKDQFVALNIYNIKGEVVDQLVNANVKAGYHRVEFNAEKFVSGQYFYRIETQEFTKIRKMMLVK